MKSIGFIGLGNMGSALAKHALADGFQVVGFNRTAQKTTNLKQSGFTPAYTLKELAKSLEAPRIIWLMLAVGDPIDRILFSSNHDTATPEDASLAMSLQKNDIIIDGANSHYLDTQRRAQKLARKGIAYLDCGTSGGIEGAISGASLMIGGKKEAFKQAEPLFKALALPNGYAYFGSSGAGHFVKMIHNGIEYGMMQAIAEGCAILEASPFKPDLKKAAQVWSNGSIIQGNLIKWLKLILERDSHLTGIEGTIGSLGTGKWTVEAALNLGIPAHVITAAVFARYESHAEAVFGRKVVQALREHFGAHSTQKRDGLTPSET